MRTIEFKIDNANDAVSIRDYLRTFGVSTKLLTKLKNNGNGILLNGIHAKTIEYLKNGDILTINIENSGKRPTVSNVDVDVIYNDEDIIVVNKPPFMPCHESRNHIGDTLSNAVAKYLDKECAYRCVFRLDRDTSGLVLIAKNELAASKLAGKIEKDYYAVVTGIINEEGTINLPIARESDSIIKRMVSNSGEKAITHYKIVKTINDMTLLKIKLETGRTHQIRVHFSHLNHPLVGDSLYGIQSDLINRQALHCKSISFVHPVTGEAIQLESDFPKDIKNLLGEE